MSAGEYEQLKCYSEIMSETPFPWDRLPAETPKSYAAFLAYIALGARRSVREAAYQNHIKTLSSEKIRGQENTTVSTWLAWSAKHKWVSRADDFLTSTDSEIFLRGARAFTLQHPPVQRVEDVTQRIEDLSDVPDEALDRDEARKVIPQLRPAKRAAPPA